MIFYLGIILSIYAVAFSIPYLCGYFYNENVPLIWFGVTGLSFFIGVVAMFSRRRDINMRDAVLLILLSWLCLSLISALPMWLDENAGLGFFQSWFESTSAITTTGLSVVTWIEAWPHYLKFYHQFLQYLGGMGVLLIVMTLLPMIGSGAFTLFKSQISGNSNEKLMPKFRRIAQWLMMCYLVLSILTLVAYIAVGMPLFDAICWMFATVSTGGFVVQSRWLNDTSCQMVSVAAMFFAATSFNLHFRALSMRSLSVYYKDSEWCWWVAAIVLSVFLLWLDSVWFSSKEPIYIMLFQVMSLLSSTGYLVPHEWHLGRHMLMILIILGYIGGCSGSTSSGIKWGRIHMIKELISGAYASLLHPHLILKSRPRSELIALVLAYVVLLFFTVFISSLVLVLTGLRSANAFDLSWTATTNLGAILGQSLMQCSEFQLSVLTVAMLVGRVECVTFFIVFMRRFWTR